MMPTFSDLENKTVLITGASRGIGRAIAESLAKNKAHIIFNYRGNEEQAAEMKECFLSLGASNVSALKFDINNYDQMKESLTAWIKENGQIQGLVNNAGISKDQLCMRVKIEDIDSIIDTNLKSAMVLTNHLAKNFIRAKDASIVNMSSVVGLMGNNAQTVYAASKAGLIGYTKSLAKELSSRQIRVNAVCPGFIETAMTKELPEKAQQEYKDSIPLGSMGQAEDVANLTLFLLSDASVYITGEVIKVDGGLYI